ncbi:hypothetical protein PR048_006679 [Dryococelus australis]|uniref:Uncharacterized protein n=1 Tax=Dryococelus australis TaxID=614101 RepID=A0ABQ9ICV2_9NEOP|nr:hypothetical protein PR048_006679 [Dryococelus australis]
MKSVAYKTPVFSEEDLEAVLSNLAEKPLRLSCVEDFFFNISAVVAADQLVRHCSLMMAVATYCRNVGEEIVDAFCMFNSRVLCCIIEASQPLRTHFEISNRYVTSVSAVQVGFCPSQVLISSPSEFCRVSAWTIKVKEKKFDGLHSQRTIRSECPERVRDEGRVRLCCGLSGLLGRVGYHGRGDRHVARSVHYDRQEGVVGPERRRRHLGSRHQRCEQEGIGHKAYNQWRVVKCCKVSRCLLSAVHNGRTQQEPVTRVEPGDTECTAATHERATRHPLHTCCDDCTPSFSALLVKAMRQMVIEQEPTLELTHSDASKAQKRPRRPLASLHGEPGSIPSGVALGFLVDFLGDLPFPPHLHSGAAPHTSHFTLISPNDLNVKSIPNARMRKIAITVGRIPLMPGCTNIFPDPRANDPSSEPGSSEQFQCWDTEIGCAQAARSAYLISSLWAGPSRAASPPSSSTAIPAACTSCDTCSGCADTPLRLANCQSNTSSTPSCGRDTPASASRLHYASPHLPRTHAIRKYIPFTPSYYADALIGEQRPNVFLVSDAIFASGGGFTSVFLRILCSSFRLCTGSFAATVSPPRVPDGPTSHPNRVAGILNHVVNTHAILYERPVKFQCNACPHKTNNYDTEQELCNSHPPEDGFHVELGVQLEARNQQLHVHFQCACLPDHLPYVFVMQPSEQNPHAMFTNGEDKQYTAPSSLEQANYLTLYPYQLISHDSVCEIVGNLQGNSLALKGRCIHLRPRNSSRPMATSEADLVMKGTTSSSPSRLLNVMLKVSSLSKGSCHGLLNWSLHEALVPLGFVSEEIWAALNSEVLRPDEENLPTNDIIQYDSHLRKSGVTRPGIEPRIALMGGKQADRSATAAPPRLRDKQVVRVGLRICGLPALFC